MARRKSVGSADSTTTARNGNGDRKGKNSNLATSNTNNNTNSQTGKVSATFALRCVSSNVCIFPFVTRNKTAPTQLFIAIFTFGCIIIPLMRMYTPWIPLVFQIFLSPFLSLPFLPIIIPLQGMFIYVLSRGTWHDWKRARLELLLRRLDEFDALAIQELFSGIFDTRYRDLVLATAKRAGLHYSVSCARLPVWPAVLLNTGTMLLSRYPILNSRTMVFKTKAFYDYFVVNRGCSWMRLQLPNIGGEGTEPKEVDFFTCHLAPPLKEVSERVKLLEYCSCPQEAQLEELIEFMRECVSDKPVNKRNIVLAADLNIDCGSLRYFKLLHSLQSLSSPSRPLKDLFATTVHGDAAEEIAPVRVGNIGDVPDTSSSSESEQDGEDKQQDERSRRRANRQRNAKAASAAAVASTVPSPPLPRRHTPSPTSPSSLGVRWNTWEHGLGNGKEPWCEEGHAPFSSVLPKTPIRWESTFGQHLPEELHTTSTVTGTTVSSSSSSIVATPSGVVGLGRKHFETFLTHSTLLGSHTTHDFFFSNCEAVNIRVEPFLTQRATEDLIRAKLGKPLVKSTPEEPKSSSEHAPPFTQLSDHCALVATLLLPDSQ